MRISPDGDSRDGDVGVPWHILTASVSEPDPRNSYLTG
jgi:hypothetical protein